MAILLEKYFDFYFRFGLVPEEFAMDNVKCKGDEESITACEHLKNDNCDGTEGAGVACNGKWKKQF